MTANYSLPPEMTIYTAVSVRTTLQEWVRKLPKSRRTKAPGDKPLVIDAAEVTEIDTAGLQLLIALSHSLAAKRRRLELGRPSQALRTACAALGLAQVLGDTEHTP